MMSFAGGSNRPPRRESSKNIDFRRLADVNDEEEDDLHSISPNFHNCQICQKVISENVSSQLLNWRLV